MTTTVVCLFVFVFHTKSSVVSRTLREPFTVDIKTRIVVTSVGFVIEVLKRDTRAQ